MTSSRSQEHPLQPACLENRLRSHGGRFRIPALHVRHHMQRLDWRAWRESHGVTVAKQDHLKMGSCISVVPLQVGCTWSMRGFLVSSKGGAWTGILPNHTLADSMAITPRRRTTARSSQRTLLDAWCGGHGVGQGVVGKEGTAAGGGRPRPSTSL